ncbi:hypothetical protein BT63DRAFT_100818 [Microthyrium microscopicum]|uniref:Uncharacterized protein n=1 Tax=Microthyrium microscopicum TaxID=703497 RepID=A0A6A6TVJ1_9PEZI|nr:hypothetical protein BT63DRAFT_100818 [Microthyrium microscopicum]
MNGEGVRWKGHFANGCTSMTIMKTRFIKWRWLFETFPRLRDITILTYGSANVIPKLDEAHDCDNSWEGMDCNEVILLYGSVKEVLGEYDVSNTLNEERTSFDIIIRRKGKGSVPITITPLVFNVRTHEFSTLSQLCKKVDIFKPSGHRFPTDEDDLN